MYVGVLEARIPSKIAPCVSQGVPKRAYWHPRGSRMSTLVTQGGPKRDPWSPKGDPKSIRMVLGTSLDHKAGPRRKRDLEPNSGYQPFWPPLAARGRSKVPFWTPGGFQKCSKIDMGRQGRHLGEPRWVKRLFKRGSQNEIENVIEKGSQNHSFCDAKIANSVGKYCKFFVLRVQEKYQTLIENGIQNDTQKHCKRFATPPHPRETGGGS